MHSRLYQIYGGVHKGDQLRQYIIVLGLSHVNIIDILFSFCLNFVF